MTRQRGKKRRKWGETDVPHTAAEVPFSETPYLRVSEAEELPAERVAGFGLESLVGALLMGKHETSLPESRLLALRDLVRGLGGHDGVARGGARGDDRRHRGGGDVLQLRGG